MNVDKKEEMSRGEEQLQKIINSQLNRKSELGNKMGNTEVDELLIFYLVCSLNAGNSGSFFDRPKMAKRQLDELRELGVQSEKILQKLKMIK